ncbi:ATP-grasp domain-containing protein [Streptomyces sp. WMMC940]|uniref:ATP-grasp domain-containing protein n=1 Tax=Streptomyces sp. WMMC940 TaxID=3015153 RepID=UPI0022B64A03|nr:ATP-grasp domain-containing protein [Streptomyces sp. WMMC940]MCZ7458925.1 ATP-grasp domain-containing protein [Streptomyces sp. WMMC940]
MSAHPHSGPRPVAVVVDGYSAGNFYPAAFAAHGTDVVHVQSTPELIPAMAPPDLAAYRDTVVESDEPALVELLRGLGPVCVIAGQESSVPLADRLSEAVGVPSNGSALSPARRDKYEMTETLRRAGVPCVRQTKTGDPETAVDWAQAGGSYPVVVKPLSSAASDGVFVCDGPDAVRAAARAVLGAPNMFGLPNTEILVQSYLKGTEYIVDTVSCDGERYVCGVWEYEKSLLPSGKNIYNRDILADPDETPVVAELTAYVDEVLAALGVAWGPAHAEVIVTEDGPVLVEIGTRLNGNINAPFHDVCLGHNQAALTALAYTRPDEFRARYAGRTYRRRRPAVVYNTPTEQDGTVESVDETAVAELRSLESVLFATVKYGPGSRIRPTVDLLTSSLRVFLTAPDEATLSADYEKARSLKDAVYRVV